MKLYSLFGIDEQLMNKMSSVERDQQKKIYNKLSLMLLFIFLLSVLSFITLTIIIFQNWIVSVFISLFISFIFYILYSFIITISINAKNTSIGYFQKNHNRAYDTIYTESLFFSTSPKIVNDEVEINYIVYSKIQELRDNHSLIMHQNSNFFSKLATNLIRVLLICVFAIIMSKSIELLIFRSEINTVLSQMEIFYKKNPNTNIEISDSFKIFKTNSIITLLNIVNNGTNYFKYIIELIMLIILLLPLILVTKSPEIIYGAYVKEQALCEIAITYKHRIITEWYKYNILNSIKNDIISKEFNTKLWQF